MKRNDRIKNSVALKHVQNPETPKTVRIRAAHGYCCFFPLCVCVCVCVYDVSSDI